MPMNLWLKVNMNVIVLLL